MLVHSFSSSNVVAADRVDRAGKCNGRAHPMCPPVAGFHRGGSPAAGSRHAVRPEERGMENRRSGIRSKNRGSSVPTIKTHTLKNTLHVGAPGGPKSAIAAAASIIVSAILNEFLSQIFLWRL